MALVTNWTNSITFRTSDIKFVLFRGSNDIVKWTGLYFVSTIIYAIYEIFTKCMFTLIDV